jgi:hypothetical protein
MIIPLVALLLVLSPAVLGGRLRRLAGVRLRGPAVILCTLVVQVVVVELPFGPGWLPSAAHVATYLAAGVFVWLNRSVPGLLMIGLGAASNGLAIAVNGGTRLWFLGDVFATPASWPLPNVFSVGDLIIVLGAGYASWRICGGAGIAPWQPAAAVRARRARHRAATWTLGG